MTRLCLESFVQLHVIVDLIHNWFVYIVVPLFDWVADDSNFIVYHLFAAELNSFSNREGELLLLDSPWLGRMPVSFMRSLCVFPWTLNSRVCPHHWQVSVGHDSWLRPQNSSNHHTATFARRVGDNGRDEPIDVPCVLAVMSRRIRRLAVHSASNHSESIIIIVIDHNRLSEELSRCDIQCSMLEVRRFWSFVLRTNCRVDKVVVKVLQIRWDLGQARPSRLDVRYRWGSLDGGHAKIN